MSEHGLFWDSKNGDRKYSAESFEKWLKKFFTTGVFNGDLHVTATEGMGVAVGTGYCNINGKVQFYESARGFTLDVAFPSSNRVDTIVVERNDPDRTITMKVVKGGADGQPVAPVRANGVYQIVLAQIAIGAGVTEITQADITDTRMDSYLCGWVSATVTQINYDQAMAQFTAWFEQYKDEIIEDFSDAGRIAQQIFDSWFSHIQDELDDHQAGHLQLQIDELDKTVDALSADDTIEDCLVTFSSDGSTITETFDDKVKQTIFNADGSITETLRNTVTTVPYYRKTTRFLSDGSISIEVQ